MDSYDFVALLPLEVAEKILLYLTIDEILKCSKVSKLWGTVINDDSFWSQLCVQRGLNAKRKGNFTNDTLIQSWREYYWCMSNWQNKKYMCHTIEDDGGIESIKLCGTTMIIPGINRLRIWNIENVPKLEQQLETITHKRDGYHLKANSNFVIYESGNIFQVYQRNGGNHNFTLKKVLFFGSKDLNDSDDVAVVEFSDVSSALTLRDQKVYLPALFELNELALVVLQSFKLFIWCLKTWYKQTVTLPDCIDCMYSLNIHLSKIYLVTLIKKQYVIKIFDISKECWLMDLVHITNRKDMLQPRVIVGNQYIVTAGVFFMDPLNSSITHLKVWGTEHGNLVAKLDLPYCSFNCISLDENILVTISVNVIAVWDPLKNVIIRKLLLREFNFNNILYLMSAVSFNLLVISYKDCFEVWNWKTGACLYRTDQNLVSSYNQKVNSLFYVQPDAERNLMSYELNRCRKVFIYNFRENVSHGQLH